MVQSGESVGTLGDGAQGDLLLELGGSPSLLVELGMSSKVWRMQFFLQRARGRWLLLPVGGDLVPLFSKFGEFVTSEQETVPWCAREDLVLQPEVSHQDHGEGFPHVKIKEWLLVIAWHGDLGE